MKKSVLFTSLLVLSSLALAAAAVAVTIKEQATAATTKYTQWLNPKKCLVPIRPLRQMK